MPLASRQSGTGLEIAMITLHLLRENRDFPIMQKLSFQIMRSPLLIVSLISLVLLPPGAWGASIRSPQPEKAEKTAREMIVLLHGLGRSRSAMWVMEKRLEGAGYEVVRIGYDSIRDNPETILSDVSGQIANCCLDKSPKLHFVGHSLGGLVIRAYLAKTKPDNLGRVVLVGTPSGGTEIVDRLDHHGWFHWLGPTTQALGSDLAFFPNQQQTPDYSLGVIAGFSKIMSGANNHLLPGDDDGLVAVRSTRIQGMDDFVKINSGHAGLRYKKQVAEQIIAFLQTGQFRKESEGY